MKAMATLRSLSIQQLKTIKRLLEKYLYTGGTNIALYRALKSKMGTRFRDRLTKALKEQLYGMVELDKIVREINKVDGAMEERGEHSLEELFEGGRASLLALLLFAANEGGQAALDKMVPQHDFLLRNERLKKFIDSRVNFMVESVDKTSMEWVSQMVGRGIKQGLSATEIVKMVRKEIPKIAERRAELISETEFMVVMNRIETEVYKRNDIKKVVWRTSEDERVCTDFCVPNEEAGPITLGNEFPSGQISPPSHARCRCYLLPVLPQYIEGGVWSGE